MTTRADTVGIAAPPRAIVNDAARGLGSHHMRPIVATSGESLPVGDVELLYDYQNRTAHVPPEVAA